MNNDFICELTIDLDITLLSDKGKLAGLKPHQRHVSDNPILIKFQEQFPFLGSLYNIYVFPAQTGLPVHIDSARKCAINIPISNTLDSTTIFYKLEEPILLEHNENRVYDKVLSNKIEVFRFTLEKPTLINNTVAHSSMNYSDKPRIILSWGIENNIDFSKAKELLNDYVL
jgi:hypothetical protein